MSQEHKMRITTKGRYGLRAVLALASVSTDNTPVSIKTISGMEGISAEFLEQIFFRLRKAGLIASVRGPSGGFFFAKPLQEITLKDVIDASGEGVSIAPCVCGKDSYCTKKANCMAGEIWDEMSTHINDYLTSKTLADLIEQHKN
jgi:Rrf2 family transcriptional regulator, iron-sulfur cluster assembly transcription factor